ncbi:uncharacterized protein BT62DRAFT_1003564 [Guyanagaster necrorhizus]|uniref:Uncharacterized protein n=1 Tax=Guyanagaster necrorhizus TaxID=856835 RepID=A0A9P8AV77_9AGAR|nr:uncharacterized protein BT62DRAFT_1003564 [Guyanagaster necrorhizus MCA 3950]KAG7448836.1 hypothetical protein BT62DRAFT_1003564 [Guyanagaster necrorhizus MCA 3950]
MFVLPEVLPASTQRYDIPSAARFAILQAACGHNICAKYERVDWMRLTPWWRHEEHIANPLVKSLMSLSGQFSSSRLFLILRLSELFNELSDAVRPWQPLLPPITPTGKKHPDSSFGPNIGIVCSGLAWTTNREKKVLADEFTPDVVRGWIEKSKVASEPTTTLQASVNLKRPTLRLSPLLRRMGELYTSALLFFLALSEDTVPDNHHHGLEFEFDCDAPKCRIYVHVLLDANHPDAPAATSPNGLSKLKAPTARD